MARAKELLGISELKSPKLYVALAAECIGTLLLNFFGVMSCTSVGPGKVNNYVEIAFAFGLAVFIAVQTIGHISGGHVNPAVTCGMMVVGRTPVFRGILYIVAQCIGAIVGTGLVKAVTPEKFQASLASTLVNADQEVTASQALGVEFLLGFVLILTVFAVVDPNRPECKPLAPLAIGLAVALGHLSTIDFTGSSMNPARSLGSAVLSMKFEHHWVYWLGPILGGIAAALAYTFLFSAPESNKPAYTEVATNESDSKGVRLTRTTDDSRA